MKRLAQNKIKWLLAITLMLGSFLPTQAIAHPHVVIEGWSDVVFSDDGKIIAINVEWRFDENYSEASIEGLDTNNDGSYSSEELEILTRENLKALQEYDYFTYAKLDGKKVAWGEVTEYGQSYTGKLLKMHFQIPLVTPIDPAKHTFTYSIYDPSFFIAIEFSNDQPLNVMGNKPDNCSVALGKIAADEKTEETKTMLAGKDAEWQPPTEEDFGSMFAQPVEISCKQ